VLKCPEVNKREVVSQIWQNEFAAKAFAIGEGASYE
jgi:hypothetical protein